MVSSAEKLKILLISPLPPPTGGIATWTKLFINSEQAQENLVNVIDTAIIGKRITNLTEKSLVDEMKRTASIYVATRTQLKNQCDIMHINLSCSTLGMIRDYICIKKAKDTKTKIIVHFHCDTNHMVKGKIADFFFKRVCRMADKVLCLNESSKKHIKLITNKESTKIPNCIDVKNIVSSPHDQADRLKNIIFVGHINKLKGCLDMIAVAEKMPHLTFKFIGKVSAEIKYNMKPKNVHYYGEMLKEEVLNQMSVADLMLFPTYTEGFPNVILEAMACGLPIVTTPVGAIPEMLEEKGGILVEPGNIEGFIHAIERLQDKEVRMKMANWNQEKVASSYTSKLVIEQIFREYSNLKAD